jgi:acetoin utilization deacetylase AcuC-like enzyme
MYVYTGYLEECQGRALPSIIDSQSFNENLSNNSTAVTVDNNGDLGYPIQPELSSHIQFENQANRNDVFLTKKDDEILNGDTKIVDGMTDIIVETEELEKSSEKDANIAPGVFTSETLLTVGKDESVTLVEVQGVKNVFCCIRPPGHHAGRFGSTRGCSNNGFCLLNNVAIGAYYARIKYGLRRFAVVDIDAHFGNGTAEIFEGDPHAFYSSVHLQYDGPKDFFFPSSNCCILGVDERYYNRVLINVYPPVKAGNPLSRSGKPRGRRGFRSSFAEVIIPALREFNPDIIFISAGFDGASTDPIGGQVGLKPVDFHWMAEQVQVVADELCGGRVVSVLEGGYDVSKTADGLATCAEAHVCGLAGRNVR